MNESFFSTRTRFVGLLAAVLMLFAPTAFSSDDKGMRVEGAPVIISKAEEAVFWRSVSKSGKTTAVTFKPLNELAFKLLQEENSKALNDKKRGSPVKIGVNRDAETETAQPKPFALNWQNHSDGHIAQLVVTSPDAKGMRAALNLKALPDDAELRFSGSGDPERISMTTGRQAKALRDEKGVYWTPVTEGETQTIEIFLPSSVKTSDADIRLSAASHLFTSAREGFSINGLFKDLGDAESCNVNVACKFQTLGPAFRNISNSVARMVFSRGPGAYTCTGTLLNDAAGSQIPYFWSAAHCIDTQASASSLNTFWFFEADSCSGRAPGANYQTLSGGAQLLHARTATDSLLVRLYDTPPAGSYLSGWDSNRLASGEVTGVHHPRSDLKKVSIGNVEDVTCGNIFDSHSGLDMSTMTLVGWSEGTTEGGSSGSGLFTQANGNYLFRGGLWGGTASCSNSGRPVYSGNADCYSSLNVVWDDVKQWLNPSGASAPGLSNGSIFAITTTGANFQVTSTQAATGYWMVRRATEPVPTADQIISGAGANMGAMSANQAFPGVVSGLSSNAEYRLSFVAVSNGQRSSVWSETFRTLPEAASVRPLLSNYGVINITATSATFHVTSDKSATGYWVVHPEAETGPTVAEIINGSAGASTGAIIANAPFTQTLSGLAPNTEYKLSFVAAGNGLSSAAIWYSWFSTHTAPSGAPVLSHLSVTELTATGASFQVVSDRNATGYWAVSATTRTPPTADEVILWALDRGNTGAMIANTLFSRSVTGVTSGDSIYFVAVSDDGQPSAVAAVPLTTSPTPPTPPTPPVVPDLSGGVVTDITETSARFSVNSDTQATAYWVVLPASNSTPTVAEIVNQMPPGLAGTINPGTPFTRTVSGLAPNTAYKLHFVARGQTADSAIWSAAFTTDTSPNVPPSNDAPVLSSESVPYVLPGGVVYAVTSDRDATAYWLVRRANEAAPTASDIIANAGFDTTTMTANKPLVWYIYGLASNTQYRLYFVARSNNGATSSVWSQSFTTAR